MMKLDCKRFLQASVANQRAPGSQQIENIEEKQARELTKAHINDIRQDLQLVRRTVEFLQREIGCPAIPEVHVLVIVYILFKDFSNQFRFRNPA